MTNMRSPTEIEKMFDERFPAKGLYNTKSGWQIKADPNDLKSFIHSIRQEDMKEIRGMVEGMKKKIGVSLQLYYDVGSRHGWNDALETLLSKLPE